VPANKTSADFQSRDSMDIKMCVLSRMIIF
jgi:hypothetical protein